MVLAFESKAIRALCEQKIVAEDQLGSAAAAQLRHRLNDIDAASSPEDLIVGNPRAVVLGDDEYFVIDLCEEYELILVANHNQTPLESDGRIKWPLVNRVKVVRIAKEIHGN